MDTREQMRTDLEAMLAAGRELPADTDRYLAEQFLDRHKVRRALLAHLPVSVRRVPRRIAGLVLGLTLAISAPLAIHAYTNPSVTTCVPTIVKTYPSQALARSDALDMRARGYFKTGDYASNNGSITTYYNLHGGCPR